jgi:hypothetical protein
MGVGVKYVASLGGSSPLFLLKCALGFLSLLPQLCSFSWAHATFLLSEHNSRGLVWDRVVYPVGVELYNFSLLFFVTMHKSWAAHASVLFFSRRCTARELHLWAWRVCFAASNLLSILGKTYKSLFISLSSLWSAHVFVGLEGGFCAFDVLAGSIGALEYVLGLLGELLYGKASISLAVGFLRKSLPLSSSSLVAHSRPCCAQQALCTCRI